MSDAEVRGLRKEIERLLAAVLQSDLSHAAEIGMLEELYAVNFANLRLALKSQDVIEQAKGVIMATLGCSAADADALLVTRSQQENREMLDIATQITSHTRRGHD